MVGNARIARRAQQNRLIVFQRLQAVGGHHLPGFQIVFATPRIFREVKPETAVQFRHGLQNFDFLPYHFRPDTVSGYHGDFVCFHLRFLLVSSRTALRLRLVPPGHSTLFPQDAGRIPRRAFLIRAILPQFRRKDKSAMTPPLLCMCVAIVGKLRFSPSSGAARHLPP